MNDIGLDSTIGALSAVLAGVLVRRLLVGVWEQTTGDAPPENPADGEVAWRDALLWAAVTGTAVGVGRVFARRAAAGALGAARG